MSRRGKLLIRTIFFFALVFFLLILPILLHYKTGFDYGITAEEGKPIADKIAFDWDENAKLVNVQWNHHQYRGIYRNGEVPEWGYTYVNYSKRNDSEEIELFVVLVKDNGKNSTTTGRMVKEGFLTSVYENIALDNWEVKSNDLIDVAKENTTVRNWLKESDETLLSMNLNIENSYSLNPTWKISWWTSDGYFLTAVIDSKTGDVLEVKNG